MKIIERPFESCSGKELWDIINSFPFTKDGQLLAMLKGDDKGSIEAVFIKNLEHLTSSYQGGPF